MTELESRGWLLDELTTAGEENLDADHVARYDRKTGDSRYDDVDWIVALGLPPEGTLVDLGAGIGRVALAVAGSCRRVVAVDGCDEHSTFTWLLEPMIERAGFEIVDAEYSENGIFAAYECAASGPSPSK